MYTYFLLSICYSTVISQTQTVTVTFKPNAAMGHDASIVTHFGCILNGNTQSTDVMNFGNSLHLQPMAWTWNTVGCPRGIIRSLIKFDQLSTIPSDAVIISAELKLFGVPSSVSHVSGNSCYPFSPYSASCPNQAYIQKVTGAWDEQTVTWNTQPTTTTLNQITIPPTTLQWNWDFSDSSADLVAMVQDMVSNPASNFGFMIKLETEVYYRSILFASSDHPDPKLWPELAVTYSYTPPCPCEANFSHIGNTSDPSTYAFMASNNANKQIWTINGNMVSNEASFIHTFRRPGEYEICYLKVLSDTECKKCITICVGKANGELTDNEFEKVNVETKPETNVSQGTIPPGDQIYIIDSKDNNKIEIYPNPTANSWTIKLITENDDTINIKLSDILGQIIYSDNKRLQRGNNIFEISASNIVAGSYNLQIIGNSIQFSNILLKE